MKQTHVLLDKAPTLSQVDRIVRGKLLHRWRGFSNCHYQLSLGERRSFERAKTTFIVHADEFDYEGTAQVHGRSNLATAFGELWCGATKSPYIVISPSRVKSNTFRVELRVPNSVALSRAGKEVALAVFKELGCNGKPYSHVSYADAAHANVPARLVNSVAHHLLKIARNNLVVRVKMTEAQRMRQADLLRQVNAIFDEATRRYKWRSPSDVNGGRALI